AQISPFYLYYFLVSIFFNIPVKYNCLILAWGFITIVLYCMISIKKNTLTNVIFLIFVILLFKKGVILYKNDKLIFLLLCLGKNKVPYCFLLLYNNGQVTTRIFLTLGKPYYLMEKSFASKRKYAEGNLSSNNSDPCGCTDIFLVFLEN
ncbi:hypothetical protein ACJX0J_037119, partial [Zea mays]